MTDQKHGSLVKDSHVISDEMALIRRAQLELPYNTTAYTTLMKRYEKQIYWMCRRVVVDESESHDATQEVLIRVFHHLPKFKADSSFKTWLYSIARNVALTQIKKARQLKDAAPISELNQAGPDETYDPYIESDQAMDMNKAFARLKVSEREILSLRFVADMDIQDIADTMSLKLSATKMRLYRATEKLRKLYSA